MNNRVPIRNLIVLLVMALSTLADASESREIRYQSSADQSEQPAMFYAPASESPVPLVVALHTWSGNYKQKSHKVIEQWWDNAANCLRQNNKAHCLP